MRSKKPFYCLAPALFLFLPHCQPSASNSRQTTQQASSPQKASVTIAPISASSTQPNTTNAAAVDAIDAIEILPQQPAVVTTPAVPPTTTPVTVLSLSPDSGAAAALPQKLTLVTSADIQVPNENAISITGTCAILPTVSAVNEPNTGSTWDIFLAGMHCQEGQTIVVHVSPTQLASLADSQPGVGDGLIRTFILRAKGPTFAWGTPSPASFLASTKNLQLPFTYTNASQVASPTPPTPTSLSFTGTAICQADIQDLSPTGGTIELSACTGTGTVGVQVKDGLVTDDIGNLSSASTVLTLPVDTVTPSVLTMVPIDGQVNPVPNTVIVRLNKPVKSPLTSSVFSIRGCNASLTGAAVSQDGTTLTASLSSSACTDGDIVTVTIDPSQLTDLNGNVGTALPQSTRYTLHTAKPTTTLDTTTTVLGSTSALSIPVTFRSTLPLTTVSVLPTALYLVTSTGTAKCNLSLGPVSSQGTTATAFLSLSGCQGNGKLTLALAGGIIQDSLNNLSAPSNTLPTFTVDTTTPTITLTPLSSPRIKLMYSVITATFSKPVQSPLSSNSLFFASSTTSTCKPALGSPSLSSDATTATLSLSSTGCQNGDTITVSADPNQLVDTLGNKSTTASIVHTNYTLATVGPSVTLSGPSFSPSNAAQTLNATNTATFIVTYTSVGTISDAASTSPYSMVPTTGVTCKLTPGTTSIGSNSATSTFTLSSCTGTGSISLTVNPGNMKDEVGNLSSSYSTQSYAVDAVRPTLSSPSLNQSATLFSFTPAVPITVTFSKPIQYSASLFTLTSSTCTTTAPTLTSALVTPTQAGLSTQMQLSLSGGACANGNQVTLNYIPTQLTDAVGNTGTGTTTTLVTYTITLLPPSIVGLAAPTVTSSSPINWGISWVAATSQTSTPSANLLYKTIAYTTSTTNNATNAASAILVADWAPFTSSVTVSPPLLVSSAGVTSSYYFAVLVKDPLTELIGYYSTAAPAPVNKYVYFVNVGYTGGTLGGIAGADTACNNGRPSTVPSNVKIQALLVDGVKRAAPSTGVTSIDWPLTPTTKYYYATQTLTDANSVSTVTYSTTEAVMGTTDATGVFSTTPAYCPTPTLPPAHMIPIWTGLGGLTGSGTTGVPGTTWATSTNYTCSNWTSTSSPPYGAYGTVNAGNPNIYFYSSYGVCNYLLSQTNANSAPFHLLCIQK